MEHFFFTPQASTYKPAERNSKQQPPIYFQVMKSLVSWQMGQMYALSRHVHLIPIHTAGQKCGAEILEFALTLTFSLVLTQSLLV